MMIKLKKAKSQIELVTPLEGCLGFGYDDILDQAIRFDIEKAIQGKIEYYNPQRYLIHFVLFCRYPVPL